jgi:VCBS repeat-containing protein
MAQSPIDDYQSSLVMTVYMPLSGVFPSEGGGGDPYFYLGELGIFAGDYDPAGAFADGQLLPIDDYTAVFSLLGTTYGGNGTSNFALPNLQGVTLIGDGEGAGLPSETEGVEVGTANVTLTTAETPAILGGTSQPFSNYMPSLPIQYEIAIDGVFPSPDGGGDALDMLGVVMPFAGTFDPGGFMACDGQVLPISQYTALFSILGTTYGGNGTTTFALPDLRGRDIVGASSTDPLGEQLGQSTVSLADTQVPTFGNTAQPFDNQQPSLALNYIIALDGIFPTQEGAQSSTEPLLGQIVAFAGTFAPGGWAFCDGQLLPINQYQALFSILGTQYGGNGTTTFALPNLENRAVIGAGDGYTVGTVVGANDPTTTTAQLPATNSKVVVVAETNVAGVAGYEGPPTEASGTALAGDTDTAGAALEITAVTGGTIGTPFATPYGTLTLNADGSYIYFANAASLAAAPTGAPATDVITFAVTDAYGATQNSTLTITDYRDPVAVAETASAVSGGTITGTAGTSGTGALAGDSDPDGASLSAAVINDLGEPESGPTTGSYGALTLNSDGSYAYTADSIAVLATDFAASDGQPLEDSFMLQVSGPLGTFALSTLTIMVAQPARDDFTGDGTSDVLLKSVSGQVIDWIMQNGTYTSYNSVGDANSYGIVGTGDFTGSGTADVLLANGSGQVIDWLLQDGTYASYDNVGDANGWGVVGTGDFTGNGTDDVLLENGGGQVIDWIMQAGLYAGWNNVGDAAGWGVVGTGDFTGNGTDDVLLENGSGQVIDWLMQNGTYDGWNGIGNAQGYGIVGTGDFTGSGTSDVLLENNAGNVIDWILADGQLTGWNEVGNAAGYSVVGTGDYDGSGTDSVLLENSSGNVIDWIMRNGQYSTWHEVGNAASFTPVAS